jgi:small-conductance mechanosensitive channel
MTHLSIVSDPVAWLSANATHLILTCILFILYIITGKVLSRLIRKREEKFQADPGRILYVHKVIRLASGIIFIVFLGFAWEISFAGISIYLASIFTVIGVALFASWSILSNLTASIILFFFFPYKIGYRIRIQDGDNSVEGLILDITMFHIEIELEDGRIATYPNNVAIQKPCFREKK